MMERTMASGSSLRISVVRAKSGLLRTLQSVACVCEERVTELSSAVMDRGELRVPPYRPLGVVGQGGERRQVWQGGCGRRRRRRCCGGRRRGQTGERLLQLLQQRLQLLHLLPLVGDQLAELAELGVLGGLGLLQLLRVRLQCRKTQAQGCVARVSEIERGARVFFSRAVRRARARARATVWS